MKPDTNAPPGPPALASLCAENIALLNFLHSIPVPPSSNPLDGHPIRQQGYALSFERERSLAGILAFLSSFDDNPNNIPAVCLAVDSKSNFLDVLLAVNKAKQEDGYQLLEQLASGLEGIFAVLSQVSDKDGISNFEEGIFAEILSMCSTRILCRLRFTVNSSNRVRAKGQRQSIKGVLQETINSLRQLEEEKSWNQPPTARLFIHSAREVVKLVDLWSNHRTPARLGTLVEGIRRLWQIGGLHSLFATIPTRLMDPSSWKSLLNIISKVSRYREAARFLHRTAKKFPMVRRMKVVIVNLPEEAFVRTPAGEHTLTSSVSRIFPPKETWDLNHICRLMETTELKASEQFAQQTKKTLEEGKIHAEIQILFYCELTSFKLPPRVICSSKDACFLCNTFITMHGKMHMPRYHGKLYPGWRLPYIPKRKDIEQWFNNELENIVRNSLNTLLLRKQKTFYPDPNESTLLTLPPSTLTLRGSEPEKIDIEAEGEASQPLEPDNTTVEERISILPDSQAPPVSSQEAHNVNSVSQAEGATAETIIGANQAIEARLSSNEAVNSGPQPSPSSSVLSSEATFEGEGELLSGQAISRNIKRDRTSRLYGTESLEVQIEYSPNSNPMTSENTPRKLGYAIERLTSEEVEKMQKCQTISIINAESLDVESSHKLDDQNCLYIAARGSVLKINFHSMIS